MHLFNDKNQHIVRRGIFFFLYVNNILFLIKAPILRLLRVDHGMESLEHLEVTSPRLNRLHVDGSNTLKTIHVRSKRLQVKKSVPFERQLRTFILYVWHERLDI